MHDLDAVEQAALAFIHTDRASPAWQQVEDDFRMVAADPHTILYLVTALKALRGGQAASRETKMLINLVRELADYAQNNVAGKPDATRDYLLVQARKVLEHHKI